MGVEAFLRCKGKMYREEVGLDRWGTSTPETTVHLLPTLVSLNHEGDLFLKGHLTDFTYQAQLASHGGNTQPVK